MIMIAINNIGWFAMCQMLYTKDLVFVCLVAQSCPTLCNPIDCSPLSPLSMGILQARTLEWVAMPSSRASSQPSDWTWVSHIAGGFFTVWATREALLSPYFCPFLIAMLGLTHGQSPWCWERLRAEGEEGVRGWDGWMASLMQWTWTWENFGR